MAPFFHLEVANSGDIIWFSKIQGRLGLTGFSNNFVMFATRKCKTLQKKDIVQKRCLFKLPAGLEPATHALRMRCSTN